MQVCSLSSLPFSSSLKAAAAPLPIESLTAPGLAAAIKEVAGSSSIKKAAESLKQGLVDHNGAASCANLLRRILHAFVVSRVFETRHIGRAVTEHDAQESMRIVVVTNPAGAKHLRDFAFAHVRQQHLKFFIDQRRFHAKCVCPHGLHRQRDALLNVGGVVTNFDLRWIVVAVTGLTIQSARG